MNFRNRNINFNIMGLPGNHKIFIGKRTYARAADPECLKRVSKGFCAQFSSIFTTAESVANISCNDLFV